MEQGISFVIPRTPLYRGLLNGGSTAFELLIIPSDKAKFLFCVIGFVCFICLFQMFLHLNFYLFVCCSLLAGVFFL